MGEGTIRFSSPIVVAKGSAGQYPISNSARAWTMFFRSSSKAMYLCSAPARVTYEHGKTSSIAELISNPRFYELTMGWPIGWTAPEGQVTEFAAWLRRSRGQFLKLLIAFQPGETGHD